ncbi:ABC transporter permease [Shewanella sp. 202IG2-18]|uniref:ABC transporter permease n=1 Tax=Parashewanella hymeniacidonis TaxID=2807618 RepID=UPI0019615350|nr:ABC transporter permease [Parashewanella hymeniacidonis]MBM7072554.1 ABC transporter permease [Parashewanella hymeniacidonis]
MSFYMRALRHGVMRLFTLPRLTLPVLLTLSLTLAAVLTVVAMSSNLIFKPLPDIKGEQNLYSVNIGLEASGGVRINAFTKTALSAFNDRFKAIGEVSSLDVDSGEVNIDNNLLAVTQFFATDNFYHNVGGKLLIGDAPNKENYQDSVWISESLWHTAFHRTKSILAKTLQIKDKTYQIGGVAKDFESYKASERYPQQIWRFYHLPDHLNHFEDGAFSISGSFQSLFRAKKRALKEYELTEFYSNYISNLPKNHNTIFSSDFYKSLIQKNTVERYRDSLLLKQKNTVIFLQVTVIVLLIMAAMNLLNLFLSHYQQREKEFATQLSLGATKRVLRKGVFLENIPMFATAAVLGIVGAFWIIRALPVISGGNIKLLHLVQIDAATIIISLLIVIMINSVFAWLAVAQINKKDIYSVISSGNKGQKSGTLSKTSRVTFILQLTFAAIVLTANAMLATAAYDEIFFERGFKVGNTLVASISIKEESRPFSEDRATSNKQSSEYHLANRQLAKEITQKLQQHNPKIEVLRTSSEPFGNGFTTFHITSNEDSNTSTSYSTHNIADDFVTSFGLNLFAGRNVTREEFKNLDRVTLINKNAAKFITKGDDLFAAIGQKFGRREVVGILDDFYTQYNPKGNIASAYYPKEEPMHFALIMQLPASLEFDKEAIEALIQSHAPEIGSVELSNVKESIDSHFKDEKLQLHFIIALSLLTLTLAAFGSSGIAFSFAEIKRFELAIRMATGASRGRLLRSTLKQFCGLISITLVLALVVSALVYWGIQQRVTVLPEFSWDALLFFSSLLVAIVLTSISYVVWRVINAEPMQALREL